jgi:hypothetical protein
MQYSINKSNAVNFLLILTSISFVLQPLKYRIAEYPVSIFLFFAVVWVIFLTKPTFNRSSFYVIFPAILILLFYIIAGESSYRAGILIFFLLACLIGFSISLPKVYIENAWKFLFLACLILSIVGTYRFVFGFDNPLSEHKDGVADLVGDKYFYLGIEYLPSTRNTDGYYFGVVYAYALSMVVMWKNKFAYCFVLVLIFAIGVSVFSLSRGLWIAIIAATVFAVGLRVFILYAALALIALFIVVLIAGSLPTYFYLFYYAILSLFDSDGANMAVSGYYTFSNQDRTDIYFAAIKDFFFHPFGKGSEVKNIYEGFSRTDTVHSENLYLDVLLLTGWYGVILLSSLLSYFYRNYFVSVKVNKGDQLFVVTRTVGIFTIVWMFFNSGIDFAALWYVLFLVSLYKKSTSNSSSESRNVLVIHDLKNG